MLRTITLMLVMAGCGAAPLPGAPQLGTTCDAGALWQCYTSTSFALCESGAWQEYACADTCDPSGSGKCSPLIVNGAACPKSMAGDQYCADSKTQGTCTGGKWVLKSCVSCVPNGSLSSCVE